jgi:peptide/nickel transport system substrate-binding protein
MRTLRKLPPVGQSELSLDILVCSTPEKKTELSAFLAETIESLGIRATVTALAYEKYLAAVEAGNFDLYLAEVKLGDNMDLGPLVLSGAYANGSGTFLSYGMPASESLSLAWLG